MSRRAARHSPARRKDTDRRRVRLEILNLTAERIPTRRTFERAVELALAGYKSRRKLLTTLVVVGSRKMTQLNGDFHNCRKPTDVLSFPIGEVDEDSGRMVTGEVIVCRPVAAREARKRGISLEEEMLLYATHGWLHLAGHDDHAEADRRRMRAAEGRVLRSLGFRAEALP